VTHPRQVPSRRNVVLISAIGVVVFLGVLALIGKAAHYDEVLNAFEAADGRWFPILLGGEVLAFAGYAMAYRGSARTHGGPQLPFFLAARIAAMSNAGAVVGMGFGGLAVDYWALQRAGETRLGAAARVLALNTLEWAVLGGAAAAAATAELVGAGDGGPTELQLGWVAAVAAAYVPAALLTSPGRAARIARWGHRGRVHELLATVIAGVVLVREILVRPLHHREAVLGAVFYWGGLLASLWGALRAFGFSLGVTALVLGFATGYAASMLPLPIGGVGGIDAAMTFSLHFVGVPLATAIAGVLAYRVFTFWLPLVPAAVAGATVSGVRSQLPRVQRADTVAG
jgi:uncharacterized membrane protein YbhN (UPF0104 family)